MKELIGTGVALITPFTSENEVDYVALENLVNFQIENGIDYLVILGTTGETATLSLEEQEAVTQKIIDVNQGRLPLVLGVGGNNTSTVVDKLQHTDLAPFKAVLSVSPYYNKPSQEGIYQHFKAVAEASTIPVLLYNVPPRTGSNMTARTTLRLANDFENIIGIKEAAGDLDQALEILAHKPDDFLVISGEDKFALPLVLAGGAGVISVIGQGLPKEFSTLIKLGLEAKPREAFELLYRLMESIDLIFEEGNPSGIKALLQELGICESKQVRLPLVPATAHLQQKIHNFVIGFKN